MRKYQGNPFTLFSFQDILTSTIAILLLVALLMALQLTQQVPEVSSISLEEAEELKAKINWHKKECEALETEIASLQTNSQEAMAPLEELRGKQKQLQEESAKVKAEFPFLEEKEKEVNRQAALAKKELENPSEAKSLDQIREKIASVKEELDRVQSDEILIFNPGGGGKRPWLVDLSESIWTVLSPTTFQTEHRFSEPNINRRIDQFVQWAKSRSSSQEYFVFFVRPNMIQGYDTLREEIKGLGFDIGFDPVGENQKIQFSKERPSP